VVVNKCNAQANTIQWNGNWSKVIAFCEGIEDQGHTHNNTSFILTFFFLTVGLFLYGTYNVVQGFFVLFHDRLRQRGITMFALGIISLILTILTGHLFLLFLDKI
jgi:hypothetical protein